MLKKKYKTTPLYTKLDGAPLVVKPATPPGRGRQFRAYVLVFKTWLKTRSKKIDGQAKGVAWRDMLQELGGLWIKVGQLMAMRTDLFEKEFTEELAKLQHRAHAFPTEDAVKIIEETLGKKLISAFIQFEETPIAAASIAQVHRARLIHNGKLVAIKVLRPHTEEYLKSDMAIIRGLVNFIKGIPAVKHLQWDEMTWELEIMLKEEVDFRYETTNLKEAKKRFKKHGIYVPKVYKNLSYKKVVVMEYIPGITMSKFIQAKKEDPLRVELWLKKNKIKPKKVSSKLLNSVWNQLYVDNYFHGDLQPGNIMLLKKNKVALIDLGSVGSTDESTLTIYRQLMVAAGTNDYGRAAELTMLLSDNVPSQLFNDIRASLIRGIREGMLKASLTNVPLEQKTTVHNTSENMNKELMKFKVPANWGMLKLGRTLTTLDPTIVNLSPKIDITKEFIKYTRKEYRKRNNVKLLASLATLPDFLKDSSSLILKLQRIKALDRKPLLSGGLRLLANIFKPLKWVLWTGFILLFWTYLFQVYDVIDGFHRSGNVWTNFSERIPELSHISWLLVLFVAFKIASGFSNMLKEVETPIKKIIF